MLQRKSSGVVAASQEGFSCRFSGHPTYIDGSRTVVDDPAWIAKIIPADLTNKPVRVSSRVVYASKYMVNHALLPLVRLERV